MNKVLLILAGVLAIALPGRAQDTQEGERSYEPLEKSLLWEVTGKDLQVPSYVYGTIHMIGKEDYFLTAATKEVIDKVSRITFEIDMEEMMDFTKLMPLMMKSFMRGDTTLGDLLTEAEYQAVAAHFQQMGLPMMFVERIKPMFLSALGSGDMMSMDGSGGEVMSYEMEFLTIAQQKKKDIAGLETAEYQMSMFDSIPYAVQAKMLYESIQAGAGDDGDDQFAEMVRIYREQDIEAMQSLMEGEEGIAEYEDLLLVNRNKNWIPVMETMMAEGPTLFAVGAGHLAGPFGVIHLLKRAGYDLRPIK